jgi:1-acyl-sn-glycerol-3-phosphate acyltransferase
MPEAAPIPPASDTDQPDTAVTLLAVVDAVVGDLNPGRKPAPARLDSRLDRELGIDSLGRAELVARIERAFGVSLPERILGEAESPRDFLAAVLARQGIAPPRQAVLIAMPATPVAVGEPSHLGTLCEVLDWHAESHPDRVHIVFSEPGAASRPLSYAELAERARDVARGLRDREVGVGDRVAIMLPTSEAFFVAFFGALYAGAVPVPIYPPARPSQIEEHLRRQAGILDNAAASLLIAPQQLRTAASLLHSLVGSVVGVASVEDLARGAETALPRIAEPAATALLQYTSGSTGMPKGVILSHANLLANIRAMGTAIGASSADVFVSWLPLYHDMGLIGAWLGSLYYAARLVVMAPQSFLLRPERWLWAIHDHRGTLSAAPNFAFELCVRRIEDSAIEGLDLSSLRLVANGSEAVSPATIRRFTGRFAAYGFRPEAMAPAYGQAESGVALSVPELGKTPIIDRISRRALSEAGIAEPIADAAAAIEFAGCGRPLPDYEIRVVDDTGRELPERREGRLQFRGPSATRGYFRNAASTRELFSGDWLESGDLAYIAGGEVFITGRTKDIIIRAGRHLHPGEIEQVVAEVAGVEPGGVAAFGSHDPTSGTERLVILAESALPPEEHARLRDRIAASAIGVLEAPPEEIVIVRPRAIPKTASGKLRRSAARELYETGMLARPARAVRRQLFDLALAGLRPRLRRFLNTAGTVLFAAYWWLVVGLLAPPTWFLLVTLPTPAVRWGCLRAAAHAVFRLTATRLVIHRLAALPDAAVIVCNHASYIDALALAAALPGELVFVAKRELVRRPIARLALRALGTLFVERGEAEQGVEDTRHAAEAARSGKRLVVFPEGTLTRAPGLMPFRLGAFTVAVAAGLPVVPVAICGTRSILRGGQWFPRRGSIEVTIAEAIPVRGSGFAETVGLRDMARARILELCGEPDLAPR